MENKDALKDQRIRDLEHQISDQNQKVSFAKETSKKVAIAMNTSLETLETVKNEMEDVKELSEKLNTPQTCLEIANAGFTKSRRYLLDPDGKFVGEKPVEIHCELPKGNSVIGKSESVDVGKCNTLRCFHHDLQYDISDGQLKALIDGSVACSQKIEMKCFSTPLKV